MARSADQNKQQENIRLVVLVLLPIALVAFGWWTVISTADRLEESTIETYQAAELEIVRNAARAAEVYIENELEEIENSGREPTQEDITRIEREVLDQFVAPISLQGCPDEFCDAWIYNPEYIIYDGSSDFPYQNEATGLGFSMSEIFDLQEQEGAEHFEDMETAVEAAREDTGWYIWLPDKAEDFSAEWEALTKDAGREIAAWTPVTVQSSRGEEVWVIGMSSMLPVLMENNGSYDSIRSSIYTMLVVSGLVIALLAFLFRAQAQVQELRQQVQELRVEIDQAKRAQQVSEIVESEYFQDLAARAKTMRNRKNT